MDDPPDRYESETQFCPHCNQPLGVQKSRIRRLITKSANKEVIEIIKCCSCDNSRFVSERLRQLTPLRSPYSYDIMVYIGYQRYHEHRQIAEILKKIASKGTMIPRSSIQRLCSRFLKYFIAVHLESFPLLTELIRQQGGYILQIDGSQNHGRGTLILVKDAISGMRLFASRFISENKEDLVPFLKYLKSIFGTPLVIIRDGAGGIINALTEVFPNILQIYCHFHFLRALGHSLFDYYYKRFKKRMDKLGVKGRLKKLFRLVEKRLNREQTPFVREVLVELYELLSYALVDSGEGLGYPFEMNVLRFYGRCLTIKKPVDELIKRCAKHCICLKILCEVQDTLRLLHPPPAVRGKIHRDAERIMVREKWFQKARKALRWRNGPIPLSTERRWSNKELISARKGIDDFLVKIKETKELAMKQKSKELAKGLDIIEKRFMEHKENLLAPNIQLKTTQGKRIIKVDRTNNGIEQDFRTCRRHGRRLLGDKNVEGIIQREGIGLLLLQNMDIHKYVQTVFGSWELMGERFAKVEEEALKRTEQLL